MERSYHYLRQNPGTEIPRNLIFVDVIPSRVPVPTRKHTDAETLFAGYAQSVRIENDRVQRLQGICFTDAEFFWGWLATRWRKGSSTWIVGYGIVRVFTLVRGWEAIDGGVYSLQRKGRDSQSHEGAPGEVTEAEGVVLIDGDPPVVILLHHPKGVIHLVDLRNYCRMPLKDFGDAVKIRTPDLPSSPVDLLTAERVLRDRVDTMREWWTQTTCHWLRNDLGKWRHTAAGCSMSAYRHCSLVPKLLVHNDQPTLALEREALVGGEFRCWQLGQFCLPDELGSRRQAIGGRDSPFWFAGPITELDVTSLYPWVMRERHYPRRLAGAIWHASEADYLEWRRSLACIARVTVNSPEEPYPVWHERERWYCTGRFNVTLCGDELERAWISGHIVQWHAIAGYHWGRLFKDFVDKFFPLKQKTRYPVQRELYKMILNSLWGKFGQQISSWRAVNYPYMPPMGKEQWGSWAEIDTKDCIHDFRAISGLIQIKEDPRETLDSCPAIAAYVTMYAREHMRRLRQMAGEQNIVYQGSDSLHVHQAGYDALLRSGHIADGELGKLRFIRRAETGCYWGTDDYLLGRKRVRAGCPCDEDWDGSRDEPLERREGMREIISRSPGGVCYVTRVRLEHGRYHARGHVAPDGRVSPFVLRDGVMR